MLKIGVKRRRTKAEIEEQKQEEIRKEQKIVAELQELAGLRDRVQQAEQIAENNKGAANILSQMMSAGQAKQEDANTITLNTAGGPTRFGLAGAQTEIQVDFDAGLGDDGMQDTGLKKD